MRSTSYVKLSPGAPLTRSQEPLGQSTLTLSSSAMSKTDHCEACSSAVSHTVCCKSHAARCWLFHDCSVLGNTIACLCGSWISVWRPKAGPDAVPPSIVKAGLTLADCSRAVAALSGPCEFPGHAPAAPADP